MTQGASEWPYAAPLDDQLSILAHDYDVRGTRTYVNVDCVGEIGKEFVVPTTETTGSTLALLRQRAGLSMRELAAAAGYSTASGIQRYLEPSFAKALSLEIAKRFALALVGKGDPKIEEVEVLALTGYPAFPNAKPFKMEGASEERMRDDLPVYGTALGATRQVDGDAIEQTTLNRAEVIQYAKRPTILNGNARAYGLFVSGSSMEPRHGDGDIVLVDPKGRFRSGDDVVVYLRPLNPEDDDGESARAALVKRFLRRTADYVELEQFTPASIFRISAADVVEIHRVIPWSELLV